MGRYLDILAGGRPDDAPTGERSETSERRSAHAGDISHLPLLSQPDPFRRWRLANAERLTAEDARLGRDPGGFCAAHGRWLSHPEQRRGACSWCVPVEPEREPDYWVGHRRKFADRR